MQFLFLVAINSPLSSILRESPLPLFGASAPPLPHPYNKPPSPLPPFPPSLFPVDKSYENIPVSVVTIRGKAYNLHFGSHQWFLVNPSHLEMSLSPPPPHLIWHELTLNLSSLSRASISSTESSCPSRQTSSAVCRCTSSSCCFCSTTSSYLNHAPCSHGCTSTFCHAQYAQHASWCTTNATCSTGYASSW